MRRVVLVLEESGETWGRTGGWVPEYEVGEMG